MDKWPTDDNSIVESNDYLIAFGQITLAYNLLEAIAGRLFCQCAPLETDYAEKLFHSLNNRDRTDLLAAFVRKNESAPLTRDALLHFVLCYDICTENRNILLHVTFDDIDETTAKWVKAAKHDPAREIEFHASVADLRLVADQIVEVFKYALILDLFMSDRDAPPEKRAFPWQLALPDRPPKPRKLTPYQPPGAA